MLLGPPVALLALAHSGVFETYSSDLIVFATWIGAWALGITALLSSGWTRRAIMWVGVAYTIAAVPIIPFLGLLAGCSTGDCL
jgi:hypothetical protein